MKINKSLFISFDTAGQELANRVGNHVLNLFGDSKSPLIKSVPHELIHNALHDLNSPEQIKLSTFFQQSIIDIFFLFNLAAMPYDSEAIDLLGQLTKAHKTYKAIFDNSLVQPFYFSVYALFLLPSASELDSEQKSNLYHYLTYLNQQKGVFFHHAFVFSPDNSHIHLSYEQQVMQIEHFLSILVLYPLKYRIKSYLEAQQSAFPGKDGQYYFSAGVSLLDTFSQKHRAANFCKSKKLLLKRLNQTQGELSGTKSVAQDFIHGLFLDTNQYLTILNDISTVLQINKKEIFGSSLFSMLYHYMEYLSPEQTEELYNRFNQRLNSLLTGLIQEKNMDMEFLKLVLKEIENMLEDLYNQVEYQARVEKANQLKDQYWRHIKRPFISMFNTWISFGLGFIKKSFPYHDPEKKEFDIVNSSTEFIRSKVAKDFFYYISNNLSQCIQGIDRGLGRIRYADLELDQSTEAKTSPFVINLFVDRAEGQESKICDLLFDSGQVYFDSLVEEFVKNVCSWPGVPNDPEKLMDWIYARFKRYYQEDMEEKIYQTESQELLRSFGNYIQRDRDLKQELYFSSCPFISLFHQTQYRRYLFYQDTDRLGEICDDSQDFWDNEFVIDAFNRKHSLELPIVQIEGPFSILDTLYYQILKDNKEESSDSNN